MYSKDFRKAAIEYMDKGHSKEELYEAFGIYPSSITRWRKLREETGSLEPQYPETRSGKIDMEELEKAIKEKPDIYLHELAKKFGCAKQAVFYAQKRLDITYKKTFMYSEKSACERMVFLWILASLIILGFTEVIYVDESGLNRYYRRAYARAKRGVKVQDTKSGKKYKRTNIIGAKWGKRHIAMQCYEHSTTAVVFEDWFEFELIPLLPENAIVVMDNASFHRKNILWKIAERYGIFVLFLPPYSPDFNPIEKSWANFKSWLVDNLSRFPSIDFAVDCYFYQIPLLV